LVEDDLGPLSPVAVENFPIALRHDRIDLIRLVRGELPQVVSAVPAAEDKLGARF
jgi:hypothetical protein